MTNKRIRLRIPKDYHQEPVISKLVSDYGLVMKPTALPPQCKRFSIPQ